MSEAYEICDNCGVEVDADPQRLCEECADCGHGERLADLEAKLAMAHEALGCYLDPECDHDLDRLVVSTLSATQADVDAFLERVRAEEREACAQVAEIKDDCLSMSSGVPDVIRARGSK